MHHTLLASRCRTAQPLTPQILATSLRPAHRSSHPTATPINLSATVRNLHTITPKNWGPLSMIHLLSAFRTPKLVKPHLLATSNSSTSSTNSKTTHLRPTPPMRHLRARLPPACPKSHTSSSNNSNKPRIPALPVPTNLLHRTSLRRYLVHRSHSIPPTAHHLPPQARASIRHTSHRVDQARIPLPFIGN